MDIIYYIRNPDLGMVYLFSAIRIRTVGHIGFNSYNLLCGVSRGNVVCLPGLDRDFSI